MQMPADMKTVEAQAEDVPRDLTPYRYSDGNAHDFGFGLNWKGVIQDARTANYKPSVQNGRYRRTTGRFYVHTPRSRKPLRAAHRRDAVGD